MQLLRQAESAHEWARGYRSNLDVLMVSQLLFIHWKRLNNIPDSTQSWFIFATDIEEYNTERGFYYPIESTPFPIAVDNDELIDNILKFDETSYATNLEKFLEDKGCVEDGHAAERAVDLIYRILNGDESSTLIGK